MSAGSMRRTKAAIPHSTRATEIARQRMSPTGTGSAWKGANEQRELRQVVVAAHVRVELAARPPALGRQMEDRGHRALRGIERHHHADAREREDPEEAAEESEPAARRGRCGRHGAGGV